MPKLNFNQFNCSGTVTSAMVNQAGALRLVITQTVLDRFPTEFIVICPSYSAEQSEYRPGDELHIQNAVVYSFKGQFAFWIESEKQIKRLELSPEECDLGEERAERKFEPYF